MKKKVLTKNLAQRIKRISTKEPHRLTSLSPVEKVRLTDKFSVNHIAEQSEKSTAVLSS